MRLYGTLGQEQDQQKISAAPSQQNTLALEHIVLNLSGVFGSLAKPDMQGQAAAARFCSEKSSVYTDNDVAFVKGIFHVSNPAMCQGYGRSGEKQMMS